MQVCQLEKAPLFRVLQDFVGEKRFENLPVVNFLFNGACRHQPVDGDVSLLAQTPCPFSCLNVGRRIPIWIEYDDAIGAGQIDAEPTNFRCEQKYMVVFVGIESIHQLLAFADGRRTVHAKVAHRVGRFCTLCVNAQHARNEAL